jgi:hypothetical protein
MTGQFQSMQDLAKPSAEQPGDPQEFQFYWYCLEDSHPGVRPYGQNPLDIGRIFGTDSDQGCPVCPACGKEVSAVPAPGPKIPPAEIVDYAKRFTASQILGGIRA